MNSYFETDIENKDLLKNIDLSIKKARELSYGKFPDTILINPKNNANLKLENLYCLSKSGLECIPLIYKSEMTENRIRFFYNEK